MDIELLRKDMVAAMKAKDKPRKEAISSLVIVSRFTRFTLPPAPPISISG